MGTDSGDFILHNDITAIQMYKKNHKYEEKNVLNIWYNRVATTQGKQGKQGIWFLLFPDRENTGNFAVTQGKYFRHRENLWTVIIDTRIMLFL